MIDILKDWRYVSILVVLIFGVAWWKSGRSPFVLVALGLLHCEAARLQAIESVIVAGRHFADNYQGRVRSVRAEVLELAK